MRVQKFQPDSKGVIRIKHMVKALSYGLMSHTPTVWAIVDPLGKSGLDVNLIVVDDNSTIDESLIPGYRITITDHDDDVTWHIFEEQEKPKIISSGPMPPDFKMPRI